MARFFIDRPIFAWVIALFIAVLGGAAITRLPAATPGKSPALGIYHAQLVLNVLWSCIFFGLRSPLGSCSHSSCGGGRGAETCARPRSRV